MNAEELRRRGLNFARRQIAAAKATKQDIERWEKEFGSEIHQLAQEAPAPKPRATRTASDTSPASKES